MNNLTLCLYTSTRGHFGRKDIYLQTIEDLEKHKIDFAQKLCHIKVSPDEVELGEKMIDDFKKFGYNVLTTTDAWSHFSASHPIGQLKDLGTVLNEVYSPFLLNWEDDFLCNVKSHNLSFDLKTAIDLLDQNPNKVSQVRIPRESDDLDRYPTIFQDESGWYRQNSIFSFNPYVSLTHTINTIYNSIVAQQELIFDLIQQGRLNAELTFTDLAKQMFGFNSFYSFDKKALVVRHVGTKEGEEDKI